MNRVIRRLSAGLLTVMVCSVPALGDDGNEPVPRAMYDYVARNDSAFAWQLRGKQQQKAGLVYDIALTSQQWQGMVWKHTLHIYQPEDVRHSGHVLLFVTGGSNGRQPEQDDVNFGLRLARLAGARVAVLHQVPNQPLLGGRHEDDLISETWLRYLKTGDASWPLLFPMVKSAVKAMDAVEQVAATEWGDPVDGFVITGASKRGWTSWLTAAADERIVATAPIVIDVLNFLPQMKHQLDTWGKYSEQIDDYTSKGLIHPDKETPREMSLRRMMDPYTYRRQLTLPKLLINGTNDRYWVVDALNLYWDSLAEPKHILYVPNAGHGLGDGTNKALATLAAFFRHVAAGEALPKLQWELASTGPSTRLTIRPGTTPQSVRLWTAHSDSKDFRDAQWRSEELKPIQQAYIAEVAKPAMGHVAFFGEAVYELGSLRYGLSTQIHRE